MYEALCRPSGTTLDIVHAMSGPPVTQRTLGLVPALRFLKPGQENWHDQEFETIKAQYENDATNADTRQI